VEATTRYFILDEVRRVSGGGREIPPGDALVRACRMIKSHGMLLQTQPSFKPCGE